MSINSNQSRLPTFINDLNAANRNTRPQNIFIEKGGKERIYFSHIGEVADKQGRLGISILDAKSLKGRFAFRNHHVEVHFKGRNVVVSLDSLKEFCKRAGVDFATVSTTKAGIENLLNKLDAQNTDFTHQSQIVETKVRRDHLNTQLLGMELAERPLKKVVRDCTARDQEVTERIIDANKATLTPSSAPRALQAELRKSIGIARDFGTVETKQQFNALEARSARPIQELREKAERLKLHQDAAEKFDIKLRIADLDRQFKEINVFEVDSEGERLFPNTVVDSREKLAKAQAARQTAAGIEAKSMHAAKAIPDMELVMPIDEMFPSEEALSPREAQARHAAKVHAEYMDELVENLDTSFLIAQAKVHLNRLSQKISEKELAKLSNQELIDLIAKLEKATPVAKTKSHILRNLVLTTAIVGTTALAVCALGNLEASDKDQGITLQDVKNNMLNNLAMAHQTVVTFAQQSGMSDMAAAARDSTVNYFQKLFAPVLPKQPMCELVEEVGNCTISEQPTLVENITNMISSKLNATFTNATLPSVVEQVEENVFCFDSTPANATIPVSNECNTTEAPVTIVLRLAKKVAEQAVNLVCRKIEDPNPGMCGLVNPMGVCKA